MKYKVGDHVNYLKRYIGFNAIDDGVIAGVCGSHYHIHGGGLIDKTNVI